MKELQFKCTLLSDVILNQKAATEGANATLDFIPGNTFLGLVAKHYDDFGDKALEVFHSREVRFGDAHPVCSCKSNMRTLHVPALFFHPKLKSASEECYVHHLYDKSKDESHLQLKQCRDGFYAFVEGQGQGQGVEKSFALKSAYDRERRRAKDECMFGYESLDAGQEFLFSVEVDDESLADSICQYLVGEHHVGRSKTAQYGLVKIEEVEFNDVESRDSDGKENVTVYADSRLIFFDENCEPTFQPTPKQLGIEDEKACIEWSKSQVRPFQYAPWNGKRAARDADRCGIEKGSVFVVSISKKQTFKSQYVGSYCNEGFGKVIYNPDFLEAESDTNGRAKYHLQSFGEKYETNEEEGNGSKEAPTLLLNYLEKAQKTEAVDQFIYERVNGFVENHKSKFSSDSFASQWGAIRSIAMQYQSYDKIKKELFDKKEKGKDGKDKPIAYLTHGVAKDKWNKLRRKKVLEDFLQKIHSVEGIYGDITSKALVNLASEMAKQCKQK